MLTRRGWSAARRRDGLLRRLAHARPGAARGARGRSALLLLVGAAVWVRIHPLDARGDAPPAASGSRSASTAGSTSTSSRGPNGGCRRSPSPTRSTAGRRSARVPARAAANRATPPRAAYRLPTERRGRFEIGPLRATVADPFGLASRTRRVLGTEEVIVFPRVHEVMPLPETGGDELDRDSRVRTDDSIPAASS